MDETIPHVISSLRNISQIRALPKSHLRYPGGKARAVEIILGLIPSDIKQIVSPFMGGGSIEIAAAYLGLSVIGYDIFDPLVDFWTELLENSQKLANKVREFYPLPKEKFYELKTVNSDDRLERAAIFYVLNRSSFSGSTLSGGMSPGHPRFTPNSINYLEHFQAPNLRVYKGDFHQSINLHPEAFLYLDPPYLISSTLYGKNGDTHKNFDHLGLYNVLLTRHNWILSYNDCPEIRRMYSDKLIIVPKWKYGMSSDKNSRELLILSNDVSERLNRPYKQESLL